MTGTLGERALAVARAELLAGVREHPFGSNTGPRVLEYLAPCRRHGTEQLLGLKASNWCMAFASWCMHQAMLDGELPAHGYRAGVVEAVADAVDPAGPWTGRWRPAALVRSGEWLPELGDLAIYDRSQAGKPETSWWRHVNRVSGITPSGYTAIGGNEGDRVNESAHRFDSTRLLGFIEYPCEPSRHRLREAIGEVVAYAPSPQERERILALVGVTLDGIIRDSIWSLEG